MLSPALINVADRLIATLMILVDAIYPVALNGSTATLSERAAHSLFFRLSQLIVTLVRISHFGITARAKPAIPADRDPPAPTAQRLPPSPAQPLPRHPGWLLEALPDIAPAIASDLAALLADPALATLLATAPTLERTLRPLLRSLGLTQPPPSSDPSPPRTRGSDTPNPNDPTVRRPSQRPRSCPTRPAVKAAASDRPISRALFHAHIVPL